MLGSDQENKPISVQSYASKWVKVDDRMEIMYRFKSHRDIFLFLLSNIVRAEEFTEAQRAEAKQMMHVLHNHTSKIDLAYLDAKRDRLDATTAYKYTEGKTPQETKALKAQTRKLVREALASELFEALVHQYAPLIPVKKTRAKRSAVGQGTAHYPVAIAKNTSQSKQGDLFFDGNTDAKKKHLNKLEHLIDQSRDPGIRKQHTEVKEYLEAERPGAPLEGNHHLMKYVIASLVATREINENMRNQEGGYRIRTSLQEVAKLFTGRNNPTGEDRNTTMRTIEELGQHDRWPRVVTEHIVTKDGKTDGIRIYDPLPLVRLMPAEAFTRNADGQETVHGREMVVEIHPAYVNHIKKETMYALMPLDIAGRLRASWGKSRGRIASAVFILLDILMMAVARTKTNKIHHERSQILFPKMFPAYFAKRDNGEMKKRMEEATNALKRLGILESVEVRDPDGEGEMYTFHINRDWYKKPLPMVTG